MQTCYLPGNPEPLAGILVPEQHTGMMDASIGVGPVLWSGWKDELDDRHVCKCGHHPNYSLQGRAAGCEEREWMKGVSTEWDKLGLAARRGP